MQSSLIIAHFPKLLPLYYMHFSQSESVLFIRALEVSVRQICFQPCGDRFCGEGQRESGQARIIGEAAERYAENRKRARQRAHERCRHERSEQKALRKGRNSERARKRRRTERTEISLPEVREPVSMKI